MRYTLILIFCCGCMGQAKVDKYVGQCPGYMQERIGKVKYDPLNPMFLIFNGYSDRGEVTILAFANRDTVLHEAFHSFEWYAGENRNEEWYQYYKDFGKPYDFEASANAFVRAMKGKSDDRAKAVWKFANGGYKNK